MPSFCLKCGENTKCIILQISRAINDEITILPICAVCGDEKSKCMKKQEAIVLFNNLVIKKLLSKVSILRDILF